MINGAGSFSEKTNSVLYVNFMFLHIIEILKVYEASYDFADAEVSKASTKSAHSSNRYDHLHL